MGTFTPGIKFVCTGLWLLARMTRMCVISCSFGRFLSSFMNLPLSTFWLSVMWTVCQYLCLGWASGPISIKFLQSWRISECTLSSSFSPEKVGKRHSPPKLDSLPPTIVAFKPFCVCSHFQAVLWKSAGLPLPSCLHPEYFELLQFVCICGWLSIVPEEILHKISCSWKHHSKSACATSPNSTWHVQLENVRLQVWTSIMDRGPGQSVPKTWL